MPDIYELADEFKAAVQRNERAAALQLVDAYGRVYQGIRANLDQLQAEIDSYKKRTGKNPPKDWVRQNDRYKELLRQAEQQLQAFSDFAAGHITTAQFLSTQQAQQDAHALTRAALPPRATVTFNALPADSIRNMVGYLGDGSPLKSLLDKIPRQVTKAVSTVLLRGVAVGLNATVIGKEVRQASGVGLTRSLLIARTEVLRAYRQAAIQTYRENEEVVDQWEWLASRSLRTCAMCIAMDGKRFPLSTPFGSHPNCRCTPIPVVKPWAELGFTGIQEEPERESASSWFERQPEEKKLAILGPGKLEAYKRGRITLDDLVGSGTSRKWGPERWERSLKSVLADTVPKPPAPTEASETMAQVESRIAQQRFESAYVFDQSGALVFGKDGQKTQVAFTTADVAQMKDNVLTHNHPLGWEHPESDPRRAGNSFSPEDITLASVRNLAEIRAVTPHHVYSMKRPANGQWPPSIMTEMIVADQQVRQQSYAAMAAGRKTIPQLEVEHWHSVWTIVSQRLGIAYSREDAPWK